MRRALFPQIALIAASTAAALLVAEAGLRLRLHAAAGASLDTQARRSRPSRWPDIVYELKPGLRGLFHGRRLTTNAHGLRGPEVPLAKPPGVFRIAGLGDSQMFGWGVSDEEVYLRRLERALDQRAGAGTGGAAGRRRFEVLNFAVPGYNTVMEVATFEHRALAFSPDLVVLHFVGNDLAAPHFAEPPRSYLLAVLRAALAGTEGQDADAEAARQERRREESRRFAHLGGPAAYAGAMARLADLCGRRGIPVLVLSLERGERPFLRAAVRRHGLRFVNAAPHFYSYLAAQGQGGSRGAWARTFRSARGDHFNALAHRLIADRLLAELEALGVVRPAAAGLRGRESAREAGPAPTPPPSP